MSKKNQDEFKKEIKKVFKIYDDDSSGYLDAGEMRKFIDDLRSSMFLPKSDNIIIQSIMKILDTDGNGQIELEELLSNIEPIYPLIQEPGGPTEKFLRENFEEMDFDASGFLDREELLPLLQRICSRENLR